MFNLAFLFSSQPCGARGKVCYRVVAYGEEVRTLYPACYLLTGVEPEQIRTRTKFRRRTVVSYYQNKHASLKIDVFLA